MRTLALLFALATCLPGSLGAAAPGVAQGTPAPVRGVVRTPDRTPVAQANVFILETLEGVLSGPDGRFSIATAATGPVTLVVKRIGFEDVRRAVPLAQRDSLDIVLAPSAVPLTPISVQAGGYTAGEERGATLTPLEVVTTPGTAADVNRTMQALPGVQNVDEGTALFVRGGDYTETKIFLNDAPLLNPVQLLSPTGTFVGTVDPFLLDGIFFSSGGFGARYGNALSAVAGLRTRGRADAAAGSVGAGLAALSADAAVPIGPSLTVRAAANRFDLEPFMDLNGAPLRYDPAPRGRDLSGSVIWTSPAGNGAELKAFVVDQTNALGVGLDDPAFSGSYDVAVRSRHAVAGWRQVIGSFAPAITVSESRLDRRETFGAFDLGTTLVQRQIFGEAAWELSSGAMLRAGGEIERLASAIDGSIPAEEFDARPGARTTVIALDRAGWRTGAFAELDWHTGGSWRFIPGVRTDRSSLTGQRTVDPRVSVAYRAGGFVTLTAAWGHYHQVPDPLFFDDSVGLSDLPSMRATQSVAGLQIGEDATLLRVEAWSKRYRDLAQQTREHQAVGGGTGRARGIDVFAKLPLPLGIRSRVTVSFVSARRTDPDSGILARAPYDVTTSTTIVLERDMTPGLKAGVAWRAATGRPYTPIAGARYDADHDVYVPRYGAPMTARFPDFRRLDFSLSQYRPLGSGWSGVFYVSVTNLLDHENVHAWRWSRDYTERTPVRSIFTRALYLGASILHE